MLKKFFSICLAIVLVLVGSLSIIGCGDKTASQDKITQKKITLVLWYPSSSSTQSQAILKCVKKFEAENPNIKINEVAQPNDNFYNLFKAASLAGNGPDMVQLWPGSGTTDYAPYLLPLNKYLTSDMLNERYGWNLARKDYTNTGDIYGVPSNAYAYAIWYNKDLMSQVGFDGTNPPKTWDELLALCEKLKQKNVNPFLMGSKDGYMAQWGVGALLCTMLGNDMSQITGSSVKYQGSVLEKAIGMWQELGKNGYINKDTTSFSTGDEQDSKFSKGEGAMMLSGSWESPVLNKLMGDKVDFFKFPAADLNNPNNDFNYAGPGINYCITNYSKNPDAAFKYIMAETSKEVSMEFDNEMYNLPVFIGANESQLENPLLRKFYTMTKTGKNTVSLDLIPANAFNEFVRLGGLINMGKIAPSDVTKKMDDILTK